MIQGISIVISAYDRPRLFRSTLESAAALNIPPGTAAEIMIIASPKMADAKAIVAGVAQQSTIPLRLIPEHQPGLSHARNQGLVEATYDLVAYFDDDVQVARDWIYGCYEAMEKNRADCVVGPVSPLFEEPIPDFFPDSALQFIVSPYSRRGDTLIILPPKVAHEVPGCNFCVRRSVAFDVGAFDPRLGRSGESLTGGDDFEFGERLVAAGKRVVYQPQCAVGHAISSEKLDRSWSRRRWYGLGVYQRVAFDDRGSKHSLRLKLFGLFRIVKSGCASLALGIAGQKKRAFEMELYLLKELGFLRGRCTAATNTPWHLQAVRLLPLSILKRASKAPTANLLYHMVSNLPLPHVKHLYSHKNARQFEADLVALKRYGEIADYRHWTRETSSPLLTFDDGYAECHSVVRPLLKKHGIPCIFFVTTNWIGNGKMFYRNKVSLCIEQAFRMRPDEWKGFQGSCRRILGSEVINLASFLKSMLSLEAEDESRIDELCAILGIDLRAFLSASAPYLSMEQLKELSAGGFTFGAHGQTHRKLNRLSSKDAFREIADSCIAIHEWTGQSRVPLSFPHNQVPSGQGLLEQIKKHLPFVDGIFGRAHSPDQTSMLIQRLAVDNPLFPLKDVMDNYYASAAATRLRNVFHRQQ